MAGVARVIEQTGTVTAKGSGLLHVRVEPSPGCARCEAGQGCGQGLIGQLSGQSTHCVAVAEPARAEVQVGDAVVLGMAPGGLLVASFLVYLMPLGLMMIGALASGLLWPAGEALTVMSGLGGLAAGFVVVRHLVRGARLSRRIEPRFLRIAGREAVESLT